MDFDVIDQILIRQFLFVRCCRKLGVERDNTSVIDFEKACDSVRRKVLYECSILIEFGVPLKVVRLRKMCLKKLVVKFA